MAKLLPKPIKEYLYVATYINENTGERFFVNTTVTITGGDSYTKEENIRNSLIKIREETQKRHPTEIVGPMILINIIDL